MNEFDSIRITEKGDTLSFEMTNELADSSHEAIFFLIRATSALIASVTKDDVDPKEVAEAFRKTFSRHIAQARRAGPPGRGNRESQRRRKTVILLFAGGLVAGACGGFFVLGMVSAARYADCKDRRNRPEEDRWKEEDQWP